MIKQPPGFEDLKHPDHVFKLKKSLYGIYVDDIIFGSTNASLCKEFSKLMKDEFEMSMMGELKLFLGIQIN